MQKKSQKEKYEEFDPIKYERGGKEAEAIVWTTKTLNKAVEAMKKGMPLKANPFVGKNTLLLKPNLVFARTEEEIEDYLHCMEDPIYFASKCSLMTPTGLKPCVLRDYQEDYLRHLQKNRFSIFLSCRQSGKSTTTAIDALWTIIFRNDRNALILSKSGPAGRDLIKKIKDMYLYLPYHLKLGTLKWNQSEIAFDNNSTISTEAFSPTAGLGKTINFLILDEFAWCPPNDVDLFYNNILPTVTADTSSNICIMSTQNGFNLFYKLWHAAETKKSMYAPFKVDWWQVPQWNPDTQSWIKRNDKWKQDMIGVLGSEEAFYYQYGTQFSASNDCLVSRECLGKIRDMTYLFENPSDDSWYFSLHKDELKFKTGYDLHELKDEWIIILVDLAEGGGNDYTTFNFLKVIGKEKFEQIGYWHSNKVDLQQAALEFWALFGQLFNPFKTIVSVEWNTYGALFYNYLKNLNEDDYMPEASWRWQVNPLQEFDMSCLIRYKKGSQEDSIANLNGFKNSKTIPGIRLSHSTKVSSCALLKMMIEKFDIIMTDLLTVSELENFEDKNGNGSYAASFGHDDLIMTFVQLPLLKNTIKYKDFMEEWENEMKVTGKWDEIEKIESEAKKADMIEKIGNMLSAIGKKRKQQTQVPVQNNNPFMQQVSSVTSMPPYNPYNMQNNRYEEEGSVYDLPQSDASIMMSRFKQYS